MQHIRDRRVAALWNEALGFEMTAADATRTFFELGGYSLLALQLVDKINAELAIRCSPTAILEHDTLARFCEHVATLPEGTDKSRDVVVPGGAAIGAAASGIGRAPAAHDKHAPFALSALQQAYWAGENAAFEFAGPALWYMEYRAHQLDRERFAQAWRAVIERHPALRTVFTDDARQRVLSAVPEFPMEFEDLTKLDAQARQRRIEHWQRTLREPRRALHEWPLLDVCVLRLPEEHRVILAGRLLIVDGRSASILAADLWAVYQGTERLPEVRLTFENYLGHIAALRGEPSAAEADRYWSDRLATLPDAPQLPSARRGAGERSRMRRSKHILSRERWTALRAKAASLGITPTVAICSAYAQVLACWSGVQHFTLNMMHGNRQHVDADVHDVMGCFSDTLLLEVDTTAATLLDDAKRLQSQLFRDMKHAQQVSGVEVIRKLGRLRRSTGGAPLMPIAFASGLGLESDTAGTEPYFLDRFSWELVDSELQTPQVVLDHQIVESGGALRLQWDCREDCLAPGVSDAMFRTYVNLVESLLDEAVWRGPKPALVPLAQLGVRAMVNATEHPFDAEVTLERLFSRTAEERPDALSLIVGDREYTYRELLDWARLTASALRRAGVGERNLVGVLAPKGAEQVCAVLGILLVGAAYVPLSVDNPAGRNEQIVAQCGLTHVLGSSRISAVGGALLLAIPEAPGRAAEVPPTPPPAVCASDLAYVIFTSGSTGTPKGVAITHRAAINTIVDVNRRFGAGTNGRILGVSELNFDLSVYDLFGAFSAGGTLVLPEGELSRNPVHLTHLIERWSVTMWNSVPAFAEMLVEYAEARAPRALASLRVMLLSGDWIPIDLPGRARALNPRLRVISLGGATEAAIWSNYFEVERVEPGWTSIPYGYPLANQAFHVLDERQQPAPDWVPGELYIAGAGLALGYYGAEALTRERFPVHAASGVRMYRTGDYGRYWSDGTLEFLGRRDTQVKIRGHRIELGDVEAALARHPGVREAVAVVVGRDRSDRRIIAYYVPATPSDSSLEARAVKEWLVRQLPSYMVPSRVSAIERLPLTANGKVDRAVLARDLPELPEAPETVPPSTPEQVRMARLFAELLDCPSVDAATSFFDAGGNSISAFRLLQRVHHEFGAELPLSALYEHPTVAALAQHLVTQAGGRAARCLVSLKGTSEVRSPLFCVHPVGGHVFCYWPISRRWQSTVWAFQSHGTLDVCEPDQSVGQMAERYVAELEASYSGDSIALLGWSMGGLIALEMARLLEGKGRRPSVVMLDTMVAERGQTMTDAALVRDFFHDLSSGADLDLDGLDGLPVSEALRRGAEHLRSKIDIPLPLDEAALSRFFTVFAANTRALHGAEPMPCNSPILCLQCTPQQAVARFSRLHPISTRPEWRRGLTRFTSRSVDGDHYSIVGEAAIANELERLERFYASRR